MPIYRYRCHKCNKDYDIDKPMDHAAIGEQCPKCDEILQRIWDVPRVTGTRDGFGVGKSWVDQKTGKVIDNWKSWESAGYRNPLETIRSNNVKAGVKRKIEKIKKYDTGAKKHFTT